LSIARWKTAIVLEELGISYENKFLDFGSTADPNGMKSATYLKVNPNGRIPAIIDHKNGDLVLWESLAIVQYLLDKYDPEHKLSATTETEKYQILQWMSFQISGQGPYFGQAAWFTYFHSEKLPSAIERYQKEIQRVLGVFELHFQQTGQEYLVGNRATAADLMFIPWNASAMQGLAGDVDVAQMFPLTTKWHKSLLARPVVAKVLAEMQAKRAESGH